jgi:hypothetical protein
MAQSERQQADQFTPWPDYRDMTPEQMAAWGAAESEARQADLRGIASAEALKRAQENAEQRRKAIGASRSAASSMVIDANRAARIAKARQQ